MKEINLEGRPVYHVITNFQLVKLDPRLVGFVQRMFVIESAGQMPSDDLKLIVPNACPKLVIPFKNGLAGKSTEWTHTSKENKITFIGVSDIPATVDLLQDEPGGNITVEFTPAGAYRFFNLHWGETTNGIFRYADLHHKAATGLEERLINEPAIVSKVCVVQDYLVRTLYNQTADPIFDFCIQKITETNGRVSIRELERQVGYSSRWLNMKFQARLGISPKNLASIIRFQQYYRSLINRTELFFLEREFYNYYYDQSHFIKDFKRFTGHSPVLYSQSSNKFDRVFYKE